jgi:hypothetical protein
MKVRPRLAGYGKLKNLLGLGHIIEPSLKRKMIHGCKSKSKA